MIICQGCFTGIEGTKQIKITKEEKKLLKPTPEEILLSDVKGKPIDQWQPGKRFIISDQRAAQILFPLGFAVPVTELIGDTITFLRIETTKGLDGSPDFHIIFSHKDERYEYASRIGGLNNINDIVSDRMPMLIDIDMIEEVKGLLINKQLYLLSPNWLDHAGNRYNGCKYVRAHITDITPAIPGINPMLVHFYVPEDGVSGCYLMNFNNGDKSARTFASLFSLTDPRANHSNISDDNWYNICHGNPTLGMTKSECRLAMGPPDDATPTRDYSSTIDIWTYADGTVLFFRDGILTRTKIAGQVEESSLE